MGKVIKGDHYEVGPVRKWICSKMFARDCNEPRIMFLLVFWTILLVLVSGNNIFLSLCRTISSSSEIPSLHEENFVFRLELIRQTGPK